MSGRIEVGGIGYLLAGAKSESFPATEGRVGGSETPAFDGDVSAYVEAGNDSSQLFNKVKKCGNAACGKVCAVSMLDCNGCGQSLEGVQESSSNNVFMGFVHGISKGPFPFKVVDRLFLWLTL